MIIGISGYTGSGKSVLAEFLSKKFNAQIIDADKISRKIMLENSALISEINKTFGTVENGKINFGKLGKTVFESSENLQKLNAITFPYIIPEIKKELNRKCELSNESKKELQAKGLRGDRKAPLLLDAPLLPLISPKEICGFAIWVDCPAETRIERLIKRTNLSEELIKNRIEKQMEIMPAPKPDDFWHLAENNSKQNNFFEKAEEIILSLQI